jgi:hypothetical protein
MIFTPIFPSFFKGNHIPRVYHHTEGLTVPLGMTANLTDGFGGKMKTLLAKAYLFFGI